MISNSKKEQAEFKGGTSGIKSDTANVVLIYHLNILLIAPSKFPSSHYHFKWTNVTAHPCGDSVWFSCPHDVL